MFVRIEAMPNEAIDIRIASDERRKAACMALRRQVFIEEQGVSEQDEIDGLDDRCIHVLATSNEAPAGAARFRVVGNDVKIQRVCVSKNFRGLGIGAALIDYVVNHARTEGMASHAMLGAQTHALDFYRKLGFEAYGDEYLDAGISHRNMQLKL